MKYHFVRETLAKMPIRYTNLKVIAISMTNNINDVDIDDMMEQILIVAKQNSLFVKLKILNGEKMVEYKHKDLVDVIHLIKLSTVLN
tara:strand:+ start:1733 stop:1993 length:261 start_codon:yes stop_codon:yes gene_type:complete